MCKRAAELTVKSTPLRETAMSTVAGTVLEGMSQVSLLTTVAPTLSGTKAAGEGAASPNLQRAKSLNAVV